MSATKLHAVGPARADLSDPGPETDPAHRFAAPLRTSPPDRRPLGSVVAARLFDVAAVATPQAIVYITSLFFFVGGLSVIVTSLMARWSPSADLTAIRIIGGIALAAAVGLMTIGRRLPLWTYHGFVMSGTAMISAVILSSGSPSVAVAVSVIYVYVMLDAVIYFPWKGMLVQIVVAMAAGTISMRHVGVGANSIVLMEVTGVVIAFVAAWLARASSTAQLDQLTKLANRRGFESQLQDALSGAARTGRQLALVLMDLDGFQQDNETHGHHVGDQLLKRSAGAWRAHLGERGTLGRFGGDEFTLVLPDTSLGQAADLADELRDVVPDGVTVSAGVTAWKRGDTLSTLVGRADIALYDAKEAGRNCTVVHGDPGRSAAELEAAIANRELFLEFQPVVDLADQTIRSYEALVRWNHPKRGLVGPGAFVPQAERSGAIHALGTWVLDEACRALAATGAAGRRATVAVNVSIPELRTAVYVQTVTDALARHDLAHDQLTIEVTEAVFDAEEPQVTETLQALRRLGVRLAIDDFGSGYSSLRWLEQFPVDVIKIDRGFVEPINDDNRQAPLLEGIIGIGRTLGLSVIIEGIETETQADVLLDIGADLAQGFLFGRPAPLEGGRLRAASTV